MADLSLDIRQRIANLVEDGYTYRVVGAILGVSSSTVSKWAGRSRSGEGLVGKRSRCGRNSILTRRQKQELIRASKAEPFKTAVELNRELQLGVTVQTVRTSLRSEGLMGRIAAKKEFLTAQQQQLRLEFARQHEETHWAGVAFTDEKCFCRGKCGQIRVRRPCKERFEQKYIKNVRKSGRFSVNVWAFVTSEGAGAIHRIRGHLDSKKYIMILDSVFLPAVQQQLPIHMIHDRSPIHTARRVRDFLAVHPEIRQVKDWPCKGADFNVIENVWAELARHVDGAQCNNENELWQQILDAWLLLNERPGYFRELVASMPKRCQKAIEKEGGWTGY